MKIRKILKVMGVTALAGALVLAAGCGIPKEQHDQTVAQLQAVTDQLVQEQSEKDTLRGEVLNANGDLSELNERISEQNGLLEQYESQLNARDVQIAEFNQEIAAEEGFDYDIDNLALGDLVPETTVTSKQVDFLTRGDVEFDGEEYSYKETVTIGNVQVATYFQNEDFQDKPYLTFAEAPSVVYAFEFIDPIPVEDVSEEDSIELTLLGADVEIIGISGDELTIKMAEETLDLLQGENTVVQGHEVSVTYVDGSKVRLVVDGVGKTISVGDSHDFNGFEARVKETYYQSYGDGVKGATLEFGKEVVSTIEGEDEYKDLEDYEWVVSVSDGMLNSVGVAYTARADDLDEPILKVGDSFSFLDFFSLGFDLEEEYTYVGYEFSLDEITADDVPVLKVKSDAKDGITVGEEVLDVAYLDVNGTVYYKEDGDWVTSDSALVLENGDIAEKVSIEDGVVSVGDVSFPTDLVQLGMTEGEAESSDVLIGGVEFGEVEESVLLPNGYVVDSIEAHADNDEVHLRLPDQVVTARITLK